MPARPHGSRKPAQRPPRRPRPLPTWGIREHLRMAQEVGRTGSFELDLVHGQSYYSSVLQDIYGLHLDPANPNAWTQAVHPDDVDAALGDIADTLAGKRTTAEREYRILRFGEERWVHARSRIEYAPDGTPLRLLGTVSDITERKRAELALRESEERLLLAQSAGRIGTFDWVERGDRLTCSPEIERIIGLKPWPNPIQTLNAILLPEDREAVIAQIYRHVDDALPEFHMESRICRPSDGKIRWLEYHFRAYYDDAGQPMRLLGVAVDITERKQAETALRESEARLRLVLEQGHLSVFQQDTSLRYLWAFQPLFGGEEEVIGKRDDELVDPAVVQDLDAVKARVIAGGRGVTAELNLPVGGEPRNYLLIAEPTFDRGGQVTGLLATLVDVTQGHRLQQAEARIRLQQMLMAQRELERVDLARDLHDGPLQELMVANLEAAQALTLGGEKPGAALEKIARVQAILQAQVDEIRRFCHELRPPTLAPYGLQRAIRSHASEFGERHPGLHLHLDLDADGTSLPEPLRMALYRIYQELMNNIHKHAGAQNVTVRFKLDETRVTLEVSDDGAGFSLPDDWMELARAGHLGLVGLRERVTMSGGRLEIATAPGQGTRAVVVVGRR